MYKTWYACEQWYLYKTQIADSNNAHTSWCIYNTNTHRSEECYWYLFKNMAYVCKYKLSHQWHILIGSTDDLHNGFCFTFFLFFFFFVASLSLGGEASRAKNKVRNRTYPKGIYIFGSLSLLPTDMEQYEQCMDYFKKCILFYDLTLAEQLWYSISMRCLKGKEHMLMTELRRFDIECWTIRGL